MSWKLLAAGLFFLFNPCVNVIDPLPDAVGCLLIMAALRRASVVSADVSAARRNFGALAAVSAGKLVAAAALTALRSNDGTLSLTLCFAADVVELIFFIMAFRSLFEGLGYAQSRLSPDALRDDRRRGAETFTYVFAALRAVLTLLPELGYLRGEEEMTVAGQIPFFARYRVLFSAVNIVFVSIAGIIWLAICISLIRSLRSDTEFCDYARRAYAEADPGEGYWRARAEKTALTLLAASSLFFIDFYVDGMSLIPDFIGAAFMCCAAAVLLKNRIEKKSLPTVLCALLFTISAVNWILSVIFSGEFYIMGEATLGVSAKASALYTAILVSGAVGALLYVAVWIHFLRFAYSVAYGEQTDGLSARLRRVRRRLGTLASVCFALCVASALSGVLYFVFLFSFPEYHIIDIAVGVLLAVSCRMLFSRANENI